MQEADHHPTPVPRLLVSVRSVAEARAALAGGCDVLDVKEPARGPLGMADAHVIGEIVAAARPQTGVERLSGPGDGLPSSGDHAPPGPEQAGAAPLFGTTPQPPSSLPTSAALGEARDWLVLQHTPMLPAGLDFAKLGLAGLGRTSGWTRSWMAVRSRFDAARGLPLRWIAVVYADWQSAGAPRPESVIAAAAETRCAGVLFDTWSKDGRSLLDALPADALAGLSRRVHDARLLLALGGRLTAGLLPPLVPLRPDVLAIRTAACRGQQRDGAVTAESVEAFREAMSATSLQVQ